MQGMAGDDKYTFISAVRGFLMYRRVWVPCLAVDGSLCSVASGRKTTQQTPGSSWFHAPSLSQLAASRYQTAVINPNDPRGELIRFLIMPNKLIFDRSNN